MIAIIILGLGLIMVATMFPVAWDRARRLSESTVERSISAGAYATVKNLIRPAGVAFAPAYNEDRLVPGSFAGDLVFDPFEARELAKEGLPVDRSIRAYSNTRVHVLHMENLSAEGGSQVAEDPWRLEWLVDFTTPNSGALTVIQPEVAPGFYFSPQIAFESRIHPPLDPAPNAALLGAAAFALRENLWNQQLSSRRFSWAVLHRLQHIAGPAIPNPPNRILTPQQSSALVAEAAAAMGSARTLDVYRVTLRRSNASKRYARQKPDPNALPDPYNRANAAVAPQALEADKDVAFPVAWRVQVQLVKPGDTLNSTALDTLTGVPTEIHVPPVGIAEPTATMLVSMFPTGARFVDEITGQIYRVVKRRVTIDDGGNQSAFLTLDREISFEDVEDKSLGLPSPKLPQVQARPLEHEENVRTVWVYPPPVDRSAGGSETVFEGKSPVVNIDVRTISLSPSG